ncbi:MAG: hypothetical protein ACKO4Q_18930, partial [Planctomycetota bacterium]
MVANALAMLGCHGLEGRTATCANALVVATHSVRRPYFTPQEAGIEVLAADGAGRYDIHPPTWRLGRAQTLTQEFGPLACFAGRESYFSARSRVERLEGLAAGLRGACGRGELSASACALADTHRDAIRRDFAAAYPGLVDGSHPPSARGLPIGRALVPRWSALRGRPSAATTTSAAEAA